MSTENKTLPKVAVIVAYYNRAEVVDETIQSLLAQDYPNLEIIAINDGSTDNTLKQLEKYLGDPRYRVINHPNMKFYPSVNDAIAKTDAEWIAIQGSGDYSYPQRISKQIAFVLDHPECLLVGTSYENKDPLRPEKQAKSHRREGWYSAKQIFNQLPYTHGTVLFSRKTFDQIGGYTTNTKWSADWLLFYRFARLGGQYVLPEILYRRYTLPDGASFSPTKALDQIRSARYLRSVMLRLEALPPETRLNLKDSWSDIEQKYPLNCAEVQTALLSRLFFAIRMDRMDGYSVLREKIAQGGLYSKLNLLYLWPAQRLAQSKHCKSAAAKCIALYLLPPRFINSKLAALLFRLRNRVSIEQSIVRDT